MRFEVSFGLIILGLFSFAVVVKADTVFYEEGGEELTLLCEENANSGSWQCEFCRIRESGWNVEKNLWVCTTINCDTCDSKLGGCSSCSTCSIKYGESKNGGQETAFDLGCSPTCSVCSDGCTMGYSCDAGWGGIGANPFVSSCTYKGDISESLSLCTVHEAVGPQPYVDPGEFTYECTPPPANDAVAPWECEYCEVKNPNYWYQETEEQKNNTKACAKVYCDHCDSPKGRCDSCSSCEYRYEEQPDKDNPFVQVQENPSCKQECHVCQDGCSVGVDCRGPNDSKIGTFAHFLQSIFVLRTSTFLLFLLCPYLIICSYVNVIRAEL